MHYFPRLVSQFVTNFDAWIVGSAAEPNATLETVRDYDILVPFAYWQQAAILIPKDAIVNTFGGWKCQSDGKSIDIWPGDLSWLLTHARVKIAWHPKSGARWIKQS